MTSSRSTATPRRHPTPRRAEHAPGARPGALSPDALLVRLRGERPTRPPVDPGLAGGLREWLEDGLSDVATALAPGAPPVRVTKEALHRVLLCEAYAVAQAAAPRTVTAELVRGVLVDALFRQWVTVGRIDDAWEDATAGMAADGDESVTTFLAALGEDDRRALADEVAEHARNIAATWPVPSPAWLGRTQERMDVPLVGGALVLSGVVDLALGAPSSGQASVCLVEAKSGLRRLEHRADLHYYALLETLRSGAPPFRVATYYSSTGELDAEQVEEDILIGTLQRVLEGARRLCRLADGAEPGRTPNPLCAWCTELPRCAPGQKRTQRADLANGAPSWGEEDLDERRWVPDEDESE